jgi:hypothetical protein
MTTTDDYPRRHRTDTRSMWAAGFAITAALLMIMTGIFQALEGLAALINGDFYVRVGNYAYNVDVTVWGWIHLILGIVIALVGGFIIRGNAWARGAGMGLVVLAAIANFLFIPYYPLWSILILALNIVVLWALAVYDTEA